MQKNDLLKQDNSIIRILNIKDDKVLIIDCVKRTMPRWENLSFLDGYFACLEKDLYDMTGFCVIENDMLDADTKRRIHEKYTLIAPVLALISDEKQRSIMISRVAEMNEISKQTIRNYLCLYLSYQNLCVFKSKEKEEKELTTHEKNMRWGLNKFFYTQHKNSLQTAYTMMLKAKYCDGFGVLLQDHPSFYQFRYFYRKTRKEQNYYISRYGLKDYQKNHRPLLGDSVQQFAPNVGVGMLDGTVCDVYLVDDSGNLVGRPLLTACIDANSGLCCGYNLTWEGGTYSLRGLLLNVISNKVEHCKKFGISINKRDWNCDKLPGTLVTDMGSEFISCNFEQIAELGVTLVNLPAYRPELKGSVEKFFDLIQNYFKPYLKGKGVIEPDFQERGAKDYRKEACLNLKQFETIILHCILFYNSKRLLENYPYSEDMIQKGICPFCNEIWEYGLTQMGANLIKVTAEDLVLTLSPRITGKFTRQGLKVNGLRYKNDDYTEQFLKGGTVIVAYNPDNVSNVWIIEKGRYIKFSLIEGRYNNKKLAEVQTIQNEKKAIIKNVSEKNLQAQIELATHIEIIANAARSLDKVNVKEIRKTREKERNKNHVDFLVKGGVVNV